MYKNVKIDTLMYKVPFRQFNSYINHITGKTIHFTIAKRMFSKYYKDFVNYIKTTSNIKNIQNMKIYIDFLK